MTRADRAPRTGRLEGPSPPSTRPGARRRLVITVCPREAGTVALALIRGGRKRRLDAAGLREALGEVVARRQLEGRVSVREGCAGGCSRAGPNVDVTIHATPAPGARPDHVAIGWKTYVYALASLASVAAIIDENLDARERARARRDGPVSRR